ncbi:hypothetical protein PanWU01x14_330390, partial [Parasponia andersonii]
MVKVEDKGPGSRLRFWRGDKGSKNRGFDRFSIEKNGDFRAGWERERYPYIFGSDRGE